MNKEDIRLLLAYDRWANAELLKMASRLTPEQWTIDLSTSHHCVQATLTHILAAEWIWLKRCQGVSPKALLDPKDFPTLESLREKWAELEQGQEQLLSEETDESLARIIAYTNSKGEQWAYPLGQIMQHVVNHSSYHRGQVIGMLRQLGAEVVMTDFLAYIDVKGGGV